MSICFDLLAFTALSLFNTNYISHTKQALDKVSKQNDMHAHPIKTVMLQDVDTIVGKKRFTMKSIYSGLMGD